MLFVPCPIYALSYKQFMTHVTSYMLQHQGAILWEPL